MIYLTIFNSIVTFSIVVFLIYKYFPFYLEFNKTFWCKKPYSITLWRKTSSISAVGVYTIGFRNKEKLDEWDSKMFRSGEYRKYKSNK